MDEYLERKRQERIEISNTVMKYVVAGAILPLAFSFGTLLGPFKDNIVERCNSYESCTKYAIDKDVRDTAIIGLVVGGLILTFGGLAARVLREDGKV